MGDNTLSILDDCDDLLQVMNCVGEPSIDDFESFLDVDDFNTDSLTMNLTEEENEVQENMAEDIIASCDVSLAASESSSITKKRTWKKAVGKPRRPLSAYNLFFQLERDRIISGEEERDFTEEDVKALTLPGNEDRQKRRHEKTHGKISFTALAKMIGNKWKTLDEDARKIFEGRAHEEKKRYDQEMAVWNKQHPSKVGQTSLSTTYEEEKHDGDAPDAISESSRSEEMTTVTSVTLTSDAVPSCIQDNSRTVSGCEEEHFSNEQGASQTKESGSQINTPAEQRKVFPPPRRNLAAYQVSPEGNTQLAQQQMMHQRRMMMQQPQQMQLERQQFNMAMRQMQALPPNATPQQRQHMMRMMQHRKQQIMQQRRMRMAQIQRQRQQMMQRARSMQTNGPANGNYPMGYGMAGPNSASLQNDASMSGDSNSNAYDMADQAFNMAQSTLMANGARRAMSPKGMMTNGSSRGMNANMMHNGSSRGMNANMMQNGSSRGVPSNPMMANGPVRVMKPNPMMMQRRGSTGHAPQNYQFAKMMRRMSAPGMMGQQCQPMNPGNYMAQNMMMQQRRRLSMQHQQQMQMMRNSTSPNPNMRNTTSPNPNMMEMNGMGGSDNSVPQNQQGMFPNGQGSPSNETNGSIMNYNSTMQSGMDGEVSLDPHQGLASPAFDAFDEQNGNAFSNSFD